MTIDFDYVRWMAEQTEAVVERIAPLVAQILNVEIDKILGFVSFIREATEAVLATIEVFLKFPTAFGADGAGLTDISGACCPDCDCPSEYQSVIWALKSQVA